MSAALSYYAIFSLAPLLILALAIAGFILNDVIVQDYVVAQVNSAVGPDVANLIKLIAAETDPDNSRNLISTIVALLVLVFGAAGVFRQAKNSLNTIWRMSANRTRGFWAFMMKNFVAILMVALSGVLVVGSVALTATISLMQKASFIPGSGSLQIFEFGEILASFLVISLLYALLYKILPDTPLRWRDVFPGAFFAGALFILGKHLIGLYMSISGLGSAYGAAGALVILLFWIYVSAIVFLLGAELTKVRMGE